MLLLWVFLPLVKDGQSAMDGTIDTLHLKARQEIDAFHRALVSTDSFPLETLHREIDTINNEGTGQRTGNNNNQSFMLKSGKENKYSHGARNKGNSSKDKTKKVYGEEFKMRGESHSQEDDERAHQHLSTTEMGGNHRDRLLHKTGNYEKGYRDQYHLNEELSHSTSWNNHHMVDKTHRFGDIGSNFHNKHNRRFKAKHKQVKDEKNTQGERKSADGQSSS